MGRGHGRAPAHPAHRGEPHQGLVSSVANSPDGKVLASGSDYGALRLWDLTPMHLLLTPGIPSPRAALIPGALQRHWGLRIDGLHMEPDRWDWLFPHDGYYVDQEITLGDEDSPA